MKYKKCMIMMVLAIFILGVAAVSATGVNDTMMASGDDSAVELSHVDADEMISADEDEFMSQTDEELMGDENFGTFTELHVNISQATSGSTLTLTKDYKYDDGFNTDGILIDKEITIDGNGFKIDAQEKARIFNIASDNVVLKNIVFTNAKITGYGGAVHFEKSGTVTNCSFTNNAAGGGGAVYFQNDGVVTNCSFTGNSAGQNGGALHFWHSEVVVRNCSFADNKANEYGGAVYISPNCNGNVVNCSFTNDKAGGQGGAVWFYSGGVTNCTFVNNKASQRGAAVYINRGGSVTNCIFVKNNASAGGAVYGEVGSDAVVDTCIFKTDSDTTHNTNNIPPTLDADDFAGFCDSGDKLTFDLKTNSSMPIGDGNISISVYHDGNNSLFANYSCLSGEGWIVDLPVGVYYAIFDTEYAEFKPINRTLTIYPSKTTFWALNYTINSNTDSEINLANDFYFDPVYDSAFKGGIVIDRNVKINGNGCTIDAYAKASIFKVTGDWVILENITFKHAYSDHDGGAVYFNNLGTVSYCNFITCHAYNGGAVHFNSENNMHYIEYCNFDDNSARYGGAVYFTGYGRVENSNFTNNRVIHDEYSCYGGAVHFDSNGVVSDCNFTDNQASSSGGAVWIRGAGTVTYSDFTNNKADVGGAVLIGGQATVENCDFTNNTAKFYAGAARLYCGKVEYCNFTGNSATYDNGGAISFGDSSNKQWVYSSNFIGNTATEANGGAVYFGDSTYEQQVIDCNFTGNKAISGSAIYFNGELGDKYISYVTFLNNRADAEGLEMTQNGNNVTILFKGKDNLLNAIYSDYEIKFDNVDYWGANGTISTGGSEIILTGCDGAAGQNITIVQVINGNLVNMTRITDAEGKVVLENVVGDYYIIVLHEADSYYTEAINMIVNMKLYANVTSQATHNRTVNITAKSNIYGDLMDVEMLFVFANGKNITADYAGNGTWWAVHTFDDYADHEVNATVIGLKNVTVNNATISITKVNSTLTINDVVMDYGDFIKVDVETEGALGINAMIDGVDVGVINYAVPISGLNAGNHTLVVTTIPDEDHNSVTKTVNITVNKVDSILIVDNVELDYGEIRNVTVTAEGATGIAAKINGSDVSVSGFTILVSDLDAGSYVMSVSTIPDANHNPITVNATVTVNKLKTQLTANSVTTTYNVDAYLVISLNDGNGKALPGVNVTVDINGAKTYVTDVNGQIKVSTKILSAKTYNAKITFSGNANYNASSGDVKVTVNKAVNPLKVKAKTVKVKFKKLKKKAQKLKVTKVVKFTKKGQGTLTYKKVKGNKKISINKKTGKVTIKKGLRKGTYKVKMKIRAKGNANYEPSAFKTLTFKIKVK